MLAPALTTVGDAPLAILDCRNEDLASRLDQALRTVGACWLVGHGCDPALRDRVYERARDFFDLDEASKRACSAHRGGDVRGYTGLFEESNDPTANGDRKECFDVRPAVGPRPGDRWPEFHLPNPWPDLPGFADTIGAWQHACLALGQRLLTTLAPCFGASASTIAAASQRPLANLRLLHYPPEPGVVDPSRIGTGRHCDYECLTLLHERGAGGLQAEGPDGRWYRVRFRSDDALLCLAGESLQRLSGGRYRPLPHRVCNAGTARRFSLPFFIGLDAEARLDEQFTQGALLVDRYGGTFTSKEWAAVPAVGSPSGPATMPA